MAGSFKKDISLLLNQLIRKTSNILQHFNDYIIYCEKEKITQSEKSIIFIYKQLNVTINFMIEIKDSLECKRFNSINFIKIESEIRVVMQSIASIQLYLSWRSPLYSQSMIPQFFNLYDQESKKVLYERWQHKEIERIETQLLKTFNISDENLSCTVVISGMAAFSLIDLFLTRNVLKPGDSIIVSKYTYFESREQLESIKWINIIYSSGYDHKDLLK